MSTSASNGDFTLDPTQFDAEQIRLMEERLIIVDNDDTPIGEGSKKECASNRARERRLTNAQVT